MSLPDPRVACAFTCACALCVRAVCVLCVLCVCVLCVCCVWLQPRFGARRVLMNAGRTDPVAVIVRFLDSDGVTFTSHSSIKWNLQCVCRCRARRPRCCVLIDSSSVVMRCPPAGSSAASAMRTASGRVCTPWVLVQFQMHLRAYLRTPAPACRLTRKRRCDVSAGVQLSLHSAGTDLVPRPLVLSMPRAAVSTAPYAVSHRLHQQ